MERCASIYGVVDSGELARSQCRQFEASLMKAGREHLAEKLEYVTFSLTDMQLIEQEPVLQQWLYGVLGDKARAVRYLHGGTD